MAGREERHTLIKAATIQNVMSNLPLSPDDLEIKVKRRKNVPELMFGAWFASLVAALIFSKAAAAVGVLLFGALLAYLLFGNVKTAHNLRRVMGHREARSVVGWMAPTMFLTTIFSNGNVGVVLLAVAVFAFLTVLAALRGETLFQYDAPSEVPPQPEARVPLPQVATGEQVNPIDVRDLCRELPAALAGEVIHTVEHLERAAEQARSGGDTRRIFHAQQALTDYLPQTVQAWKRQSSESRDPAELADALAQIRDIAQPSALQSEQAQREWEVQQRFLLSKMAEVKG